MARSALLTALGCLFLLPLAGVAQPVDRTFEGRVEVSEVLFDVVVMDKKGNVVTGLGSDDFAIEVDGRRVEPAAVSFYTTRYASTGAGSNAAVQEVPASRYFIFFMHDQRRAAGPGNQLLQQQLVAGARSKDWVEEEMEPSDWIAVVSYDVKLKVHQDFTQDKALILNALEGATQGDDPERDRPRHSSASYTDASLLRRLPSGIDLRDETKNMYDALRILAEASGHVVGRKNLLLFSIGFGEIGRDPIALPDRRYYPALEEALNANNVAVYPIDLTPRNAEHLQSHFLNTLANDTGGSYNQFFTNFLTPLRQVAKEASGYYVISYRAEHPAGRQGYQAVSIRTTDKRFEARGPKGYRFGG